MKIQKLISKLMVLCSVIGIVNCCCEKKSEYKELNEKVFVQVYCDVVTYSDVVNSKQREAFVDSVLNSYKISREEFQYTVDAYSKDERKWEKIFTKIVAELERREREMTTGGDSTNVMNP
ncbi:MAG: DUF4296 domain-containing protein [bacterium]|nr:MAG: DUF4296 domain-containing protein [bacterium]